MNRFDVAFNAGTQQIMMNSSIPTSGLGAASCGSYSHRGFGSGAGPIIDNTDSYAKEKENYLAEQ